MRHSIVGSLDERDLKGGRGSSLNMQFTQDIFDVLSTARGATLRMLRRKLHATAVAIHSHGVRQITESNSVPFRRH